jgi:hypothetical protein
MTEAVERGPYKSALSQDMLQHFAKEAAEKVAVGQATIVDWDSIKDSPTHVTINFTRCLKYPQVEGP